MKVLGVIPARYASSRFPGKPLVDIAGKSMIQRVYEQVLKAPNVHQAVVATDDQRIFDHCKALNIEVTMTDSTHQSGTDRCAEVAQKMQEFDIIINIQGDEPFIQPSQIEKVVQPFFEKNDMQITTLAKQITTIDALFNPNTVKVVLGAAGHALYFSRSAIPHQRGTERKLWLSKGPFFKHLGIYGFRRNTLLAVAKLPIGLLEQRESLEQLRWLEQGVPIFVGITTQEALGIDTPADLEHALSYLQNNKS